ncbi:MAG: hypothetical protein AB7F86_06020 [Bdellovibrionales bacterium]
MRILIITTLLSAMAVGCASKGKKDTSEMSPTPAAAAGKTEAKKMDAKQEMAKNSTGSKVECSLKNDTRIMEIRGKEKGCEVGYTKWGQENVLWSSMNGTEYCEEKVTGLKEKLEAAGFTCK